MFTRCRNHVHSSWGVVLYRDHSDGACVAFLLLDREIFTLKIIRVEDVKFSQFVEILTVDGYSMDECLERS